MRIFILLLITSLFLGCAGSKEIQKTEDENNDRIIYDESFDPNKLNDDDLDLPEIDYSTNKLKNNNSKNDNDRQTTVPKESNGFRVQIIATQDYEKATLLEEKAKNQFGTNGHATYLSFEAPLYKIRLGDFSETERNNAEELRNTAIDYGYREAFIVRAKVLLNNNNQDSNF